jgi:hypothetical protein
MNVQASKHTFKAGWRMGRFEDFAENVAVRVAPAEVQTDSLNLHVINQPPLLGAQAA